MGSAKAVEATSARMTDLTESMLIKIVGGGGGGVGNESIKVREC
jgi:hypothetical protein